jgi:hypothetical protein
LLQGGKVYVTDPARRPAGRSKRAATQVNIVWIDCVWRRRLGAFGAPD